jgi:hypothetical protein
MIAGMYTSPCSVPPLVGSPNAPTETEPNRLAWALWAYFPPVIRFSSFCANSGNFRLRFTRPAVAPHTQRKQTPACSRTAGQLTGRLQANEAREKRALLGLTHRAEVDGRRSVRGRQHDERSPSAKRSGSCSGRIRRSISSRRRSRGSDARGAGSGNESGPASNQPAEKIEPRHLAAVARLRRRVERKRHVDKLDRKVDVRALHGGVGLVAKLQG